MQKEIWMMLVSIEALHHTKQIQKLKEKCKIASKLFWINCLPQWWVVLNDELSWLFTNWLSATTVMKVKRMGITEILRRIWLFSANKIKCSESFSKQPTQLIVELNSSLRQIIDSIHSPFHQSLLQSGFFFNCYF